ncbi:MAG: hypothetical protein ACPGO3_08585, partial [Magnetospiraceae bacterium]
MARYVTLRDALRRPHEFMLSAIGLEYPDEPGVYAFVVDHRSDFEVFSTQANVTELGDGYLNPDDLPLTHAFSLGGFT